MSGIEQNYDNNDLFCLICLYEIRVFNLQLYLIIVYY